VFRHGRHFFLYRISSKQNKTSARPIPHINFKKFSIINDHLDVDFDVYTGKYYPVVYLNDYWNLLADYYPINNTFE
jgi:hypothetical protein